MGNEGTPHPLESTLGRRVAADHLAIEFAQEQLRLAQEMYQAYANGEAPTAEQIKRANAKIYTQVGESINRLKILQQAENHSGPVFSLTDPSPGTPADKPLTLGALISLRDIYAHPEDPARQHKLSYDFSRILENRPQILAYVAHLAENPDITVQQREHLESIRTNYEQMVAPDTAHISPEMLKRAAEYHMMAAGASLGRLLPPHGKGILDTDTAKPYSELTLLRTQLSHHFDAGEIDMPGNEHFEAWQKAIGEKMKGFTLEHYVERMLGPHKFQPELQQMLAEHFKEPFKTEQFDESRRTLSIADIRNRLDKGMPAQMGLLLARLDIDSKGAALPIATHENIDFTQEKLQEIGNIAREHFQALQAMAEQHGGTRFFMQRQKREHYFLDKGTEFAERLENHRYTQTEEGMAITERANAERRVAGLVGKHGRPVRAAFENDILTNPPTLTQLQAWQTSLPAAVDAIVAGQDPGALDAETHRMIALFAESVRNEKKIPPATKERLLAYHETHPPVHTGSVVEPVDPSPHPHPGAAHESMHPQHAAPSVAAAPMAAAGLPAWLNNIAAQLNLVSPPPPLQGPVSDAFAQKLLDRKFTLDDGEKAGRGAVYRVDGEFKIGPEGMYPDAYLIHAFGLHEHPKFVATTVHGHTENLNNLILDFHEKIGDIYNKPYDIQDKFRERYKNLDTDHVNVIINPNTASWQYMSGHLEPPEGYKIHLSIPFEGRLPPMPQPPFVVPYNQEILQQNIQDYRDQTVATNEYARAKQRYDTIREPAFENLKNGVSRMPFALQEAAIYSGISFREITKLIPTQRYSNETNQHYDDKIAGAYYVGSAESRYMVNANGYKGKYFVADHEFGHGVDYNLHGSNEPGTRLSDLDEWRVAVNRYSARAIESPNIVSLTSLYKSYKQENFQEEFFAETTRRYIESNEKHNGDFKKIDAELSPELTFLWEAYRDHMLPRIERGAAVMKENAIQHEKWRMENGGDGHSATTPPPIPNRDFSQPASDQPLAAAPAPQPEPQRNSAQQEATAAPHADGAPAPGRLEKGFGHANRVMGVSSAVQSFQHFSQTGDTDELIVGSTGLATSGLELAEGMAAGGKFAKIGKFARLPGVQYIGDAVNIGLAVRSGDEGRIGSATIGSAGGLVGGTIGGMVGGPPGAAIGAVLGGTIGNDFGQPIGMLFGDEKEKALGRDGLALTATEYGRGYLGSTGGPVRLAGSLAKGTGQIVSGLGQGMQWLGDKGEELTHKAAHSIREKTAHSNVVVRHMGEATATMVDAVGTLQSTTWQGAGKLLDVAGKKLEEGGSWLKGVADKIDTAIHGKDAPWLDMDKKKEAYIQKVDALAKGQSVAPLAPATPAIDPRKKLAFGHGEFSGAGAGATYETTVQMANTATIHRQYDAMIKQFEAGRDGTLTADELKHMTNAERARYQNELHKLHLDDPKIDAATLAKIAPELAPILVSLDIALQGQGSSTYAKTQNTQQKAH